KKQSEALPGAPCLISDSDLMTTLRATAGQHFATVGGSHASAETVNAFALQIAGLEGSFHGGDLIVYRQFWPVGARLAAVGKRTRNFIEAARDKQCIPHSAITLPLCAERQRRHPIFTP